MPRACLPEIGHVRVCTAGHEWLLVPSLGAMAELGSPEEVVTYCSELHSVKKAYRYLAAINVISSCCVEGDPCALVGDYIVETGEHVPGAIPTDSMVHIARHLMRHAVVGKASKKRGSGSYTSEFQAVQHMAAAVVHLGMSMQEAGELTMTQLHMMLEQKYPEMRAAELPDREAYYSQMRELTARRKAANV